MRILQLSAVYTPDPGGVATCVANLVHGLVQLGHEVSVVTLNKDDTQRRDGSGRLSIYKRPRRQVAEFDGRRVFGEQVMDFLLERWSELRPQLIHAHDYDSLFLSWQLKAIFQVPVVFTVHRAPSPWRQGRFQEDAKDCFMETIRQACVIDAMIVPSKASRLVLQEQGFGATVVVPHGISEHLTTYGDDKEALDSLACLAGRGLVLCPSRADQHKDPETFLEAAAVLRRESPELNVAFLIGVHPDDPHREKLRDRARVLGLLEGEDVVFRNYEWKQMATVFRKAVLTVVPSRHESFGISVLESFMFSVPVVAANTSALREIVVHGKNGLLFTDGNYMELASQMRRLLENKVLASELAVRGKQTVGHGEQYSYTKMARRHQHVYEGLLDR